MINAVNVKTGEPHVTSDDIRNLNAALVGEESYVSSLRRALSAETIDSNTLRIYEGSGFFNGCFFRVEGYEDATIATGAVGYNRIDVIALKYANENNVERITIETFTGTKTTETPTTPTIPDVSILDGAPVAYMPLYEVALEGINVISVTAVFERLSNLPDTVTTLNQKILDLKNTLTQKIATMPIIQTGTVTITPSAANTPAWETVTFPEPFPGVPDVIPVPQSTVIGTSLLGVSVYGRTETSCRIYVTRTNVVATPITWTAIYIPQ